jgi:hypothetical protein
VEPTTKTGKLLQQMCPRCYNPVVYRQGEGPVSPFCIFDGAKLLPAKEIAEEVLVQ